MQKIEKKAMRAQAKKDARANMVNPYKVGQVLYDSWGYEQTNIDFYQIVEVKPKSVVWREIGQNIVPGSSGNMCEHVTPAVDKFVGEPETKPLQVTVDEDGKTDVYLKSRHGWIMNYDRGEKGVYQSHYA